MSMKRLCVLACVVAVGLTAAGCVTGETYGVVTDANATTLNGAPVPGNNSFGDHWVGFADNTWNRSVHICHTLNWLFLNTNSEDVPYESFFDDQLPRATFEIGRTFDKHLMNYDWDDPFVGAGH